MLDDPWLAGDAGLPEPAVLLSSIARNAGLKMDRDLNAALNLQSYGLASPNGPTGVLRASSLGETLLAAERPKAGLRARGRRSGSGRSFHSSCRGNKRL